MRRRRSLKKEQFQLFLLITPASAGGCCSSRSGWIHRRNWRPTAVFASLWRAIGAFIGPQVRA